MPIETTENPTESIKFGKYPIKIALWLNEKNGLELYVSERTSDGLSDIIHKMLKEKNIVITIEPEYHSAIEIVTNNIDITISMFTWLDFYNEGILGENAVINIYKV